MRHLKTQQGNHSHLGASGIIRIFLFHRQEYSGRFNSQVQLSQTLFCDRLNIPLFSVTVLAPRSCVFIFTKRNQSRISAQIQIIFSNTAKTILSIEDKNPSFAKRLASGGDRRKNNIEKKEKKRVDPCTLNQGYGILVTIEKTRYCAAM